MAFTKASASNEDAIRSCLKGLQNVMGRDRPCTHDPDRPEGGRILHPTDPSQVSRSISSPGAQKSNNLRLKIFSHYLLHTLNSNNQILNANIQIIKTPLTPSLSPQGRGEG
jgi:hypothetical protein